MLQNLDDDTTSEAEVPSKYNIGEEIWVKLDSNTKWMPGKIEQALPNQSYIIKMVDGWIFQKKQIPHYSSDDKVPNGLERLHRCYSNSNVPTICVQGKIKALY